MAKHGNMSSKYKGYQIKHFVTEKAVDINRFVHLIYLIWSPTMQTEEDRRKENGDKNSLKYMLNKIKQCVKRDGMLLLIICLL
jgi:hypothetical protein